MDAVGTEFQDCVMYSAARTHSLLCDLCVLLIIFFMQIIINMHNCMMLAYACS